MKQGYFFLLFLFVITFSACQQRMYFPERVNTLGFKGANELKATFGGKLQANGTDSNVARGSGFSPSFDIGYAITDHIAILASYKSVLDRNITEFQLFRNENITYGGQFNGHSIEGGGGYFSTFDDRGRVEVFAGYGNGTLSRVSFKTIPDNYNTRYSRFFLQSAVGYSSDVFNISGGIRMTMQHFYDFESPDPDLQYNIAATGNVTSQSFVFIQPFVNMEVGYKYAKFNTQVGFSRELTNGKIGGNLPIYISMGFVFYYAPRFFNTKPVPVETE